MRQVWTNRFIHPTTQVRVIVEARFFAKVCLDRLGSVALSEPSKPTAGRCAIWMRK